ncbi:FAD:protein FMN transferase [Pseudorhodobacter sp. W20_MBD10_FR17]|uniref:FAD:protein FMN transferase n=1 Tax=Pseudorhodobacter sp. W20_MBD10_FR17 TaxID=3240266 RepID=UPI003F99AE8E
MQKMSINPDQLRLQGPTMGTIWSVVIDGLDAQQADLLRPTLQAALQQAVQEVDDQMSTWRMTSDLMRLNAAPVGQWLDLPARLMHVLAAGLTISHATDGAFDMNVGDAVRAWGFGPLPIDLGHILAASQTPRIRATEALQLDEIQGRARKTAPLALDLSGIAKGYGVDRLAEVLACFGISHALCAIDGELRALGTQADGTPWAVAVETPDGAVRTPHSYVALADGAVATSGDYRHFVAVKGQRLSHTMDPERRAPVVGAAASVSVLAQTCMKADAMATALMGMGLSAGLAHARKNGISALFLTREAGAIQAHGVGVFAA